MAVITKFQDLRCWQEARKLVSFVYKLTQQKVFEKEYELKGQLRKTVISIMNNIAEGFSRINRNDFMRFIDYSQSSASEHTSMSYILENMNMIDEETLVTFRNLIDTTRNQTLGLAKHIKTGRKTDSVNEPETDYFIAPNTPINP